MNKIEYDTKSDLSENVLEILAGTSLIKIKDSLEIQKMIFPKEEFDVTILLEEIKMGLIYFFI